MFIPTVPNNNVPAKQFSLFKGLRPPNPEDYMNEPVDKMVASGSKKPEAADGAKKGAIVNPFHARLIAKHQQEAVEKAKAEFEAKAKLQEEA